MFMKSRFFNPLLISLLLLGACRGAPERPEPKLTGGAPGTGELGGLVATLQGPAKITKGQQVSLTLVLHNTGQQARVLPINETEIARSGQAVSRRMVVLSLAAGPRAGPGLVADRFQLSIRVRAGENNLYIPAGKTARLTFGFSASSLPRTFKRFTVQAIYFLPPDGTRGGASHLTSNRLTINFGRKPRARGPLRRGR